MKKIEWIKLPPYLASVDEKGYGNISIIDKTTGENLSNKYPIIYADEKRQFFIEFCRDGFGDEYLLRRRNFRIEKGEVKM